MTKLVHESSVVILAPRTDCHELLTSHHTHVRWTRAEVEMRRAWAVTREAVTREYKSKVSLSLYTYFKFCIRLRTKGNAQTVWNNILYIRVVGEWGVHIHKLCILNLIYSLSRSQTNEVSFRSLRNEQRTSSLVPFLHRYFDEHHCLRVRWEGISLLKVGVMSVSISIIIIRMDLTYRD